MTGFVKHDAGKNLLGCLPPRALISMGWALSYGARKYSRNNWRKNRSYATYYDALCRHIFSWWSGEDKDPESGLPHLAHAGCCLMYLLELEELGLAEDDRPRAPAAAQVGVGTAAGIAPVAIGDESP